jgi:hypothetical protein
MKLRTIGAGICLLLVGTAATPQSQQVHRCEGKDGKVTYSNTQCPEGTKPVRKVNTDPPVKSRTSRPRRTVQRRMRPR